MPLLLCDLDDTLFDNAAAFDRWVHSFVEQHNCLEDLAELLSFSVAVRSEGRESQFLRMLTSRYDLGITLSEMTDLYYDQSIALLVCENQTKNSLRYLRDFGWQIAIVTNGGKYQEQKIHKTGLDSLVDAWCVSETEGTAKPDPQLLEIAAHRCGTELTDAWLIGDNPATDIVAAHRSGIRSVWIRHGRRWTETDFAPTLQADSFAGGVADILAMK